MFYTLQNASQEQCKHHSDGGQHASSLHDIARAVIAACLTTIFVFNAISHSGLAVSQI